MEAAREPRSPLREPFQERALERLAMVAIPPPEAEVAWLEQIRPEVAESWEPPHRRRCL
jgi:hypothetical protein